MRARVCSSDIAIERITAHQRASAHGSHRHNVRNNREMHLRVSLNRHKTVCTIVESTLLKKEVVWGVSTDRCSLEEEVALSSRDNVMTVGGFDSEPHRLRVRRWIRTVDSRDYKRSSAVIRVM